jgi:parvulin-like peptidyl-prolyl isomerase
MLMLGSGCAKDDPGEMVRTAFIQRPAHAPPVRRPMPEDQAGQILYDTASVNLLDPNEAQRELAEAEAQRVRVTQLSEAVREAVTLPSSPPSPATPSTGPTTGPAAPSASPRAPGRTTGAFMQLGAVVTSVNGQPIYADKVLASLSRLFAAEARTRDERAFSVFARNEIERQVRSFIGNELEVAAARKNLDTREQELARELATKWRQQQITLAEGSLENARARAAAEGADFEQLVEDRHREILVQLYYQKRLFPRVQVTADDMRRFYQSHVNTMFTTHDEARFRLIRVDVQRTGSRERALEKVQSVRQRALNGEDFAKLAAEINDDPSLKRSGGDAGPVQRGAFVLEPVEEAVWRLQPGQVTEPIQIGDSFYLAKLESRKDGRVRPFEDEQVQLEIEKELRKEQINAQRDRRRQELLRDAVIFPDPPHIEPIVAMAMQKYPQWSSGPP